MDVIVKTLPEAIMSNARTTSGLFLHQDSAYATHIYYVLRSM